MRKEVQGVRMQPGLFEVVKGVRTAGVDVDVSYKRDQYLSRRKVAHRD